MPEASSSSAAMPAGWRPAPPQILALAWIGLLAAVFYIYGRWAIDDYYTKAIPHYDSVGLYIKYFKLLDLIRAEGLGAALATMTGDSLSPLQVMFTILFSPVLEKSMASFHLYNTLCLLPALLSMYYCARSLRLTRGIALLFAATLLAPGGLYWWDMGVFDLRRDTGTLFLLTATLFGLIAYFRGEFPSERARTVMGVCAGVSAGLCLLSRDTAFGFLFGVAVLPALLLWLWAFWRKSILANTRDLAAPLAGFVPGLLVWLFFLQGVLDRIFDPYLFYGAGNPPLATLQQNAILPLFLLTDLFEPYVWLKGTFATSTILGLLALTAAIGAVASLIRTGSDEDSSSFGAKASSSIALLGISAVVLIYVSVFLAFVVGWQPLEGQPLLVTAAPYYYALPAFYCIVLALLVLLPRNQGTVVQALVAVLGFAVITAGLSTRSQTRKPEYPEWFTQMHLDVGRVLATVPDLPVVAELSDTLRLPAVQLLAIQNGGREPQRLRFTYAERSLDFAVAGPEDPSENAAFEKTIIEAVLCQSDFVLVETDINRYKDPGSAKYLNSQGAAMVQEITSALPQSGRTRYGPVGEPPMFELIDNRTRSACQSGAQSG